MSPSLDDIFSESGVLSRILPGYLSRPGQIQMARKVAQATAEGRHVMIEAGTGVGKSFAYSIPVLMSRKKGDPPVVISTGTIALQEQLVHKDLPILERLFERPLKIGLAKGRSHFLCEHRLTRNWQQRESLCQDAQDMMALTELMERGRLDTVTTRMDLNQPISDDLWAQVCSEGGVCGGKECKAMQCSWIRQKTALLNSDVIVANHSLVAVHFRILASGGSLLPPFKHLILDEAHHCPDIIGKHFGMELSNTRVLFALDQLHTKKSKGFLHRLNPEPVQLMRVVDDIRASQDGYFYQYMMWLKTEGPENGRMRQAPQVNDGLSPELHKLADLLENWAKTASAAGEEAEFRLHASRIRGLALETQMFVRQEDYESVYWVELGPDRGSRRRITLTSAPVDPSESIRKLLLDMTKSVVMTSATLSAGESFSYFSKRMGSQEIEGLRVPSPFDLGEQLRLLTTRRGGDPNDEQSKLELPDRVAKCLDLTDGGALILLTSFSSLLYLQDCLQPLCAERGWELLAQGKGQSRSHLLARMRQNPRSVLLGNFSFWEGVDVPGHHLRNVIIPRLPFEVPDHPLFEARQERIQAKGGSSFRELSLPMALIRFKQGLGRLIRMVDDVGLICLLDTRVHSKTYGREFLDMLPSRVVLCDSLPDVEFMERLKNSHIKALE